MSPTDSAAAYERYISENWDRLSPIEQDQARAYMQAKFEGVAPAQPQIQPQPQPLQQPFMPGMPQQPGFPAASPMYGSNPTYGYGYGYGPGAFGPPKQDEGGWAVPVGYLGVLFFTPLAIYCGIYNMSKGRTGHGLAQILIPVAIILFVVMIVVSMP
jgi:hypothetical protein